MGRIIALASLLFLSLALPATAERWVSDQTQRAIDEGLDAVKAQSWDVATSRFWQAIDRSASEALWQKTEEQYAAFGAHFPSYVFYNLALASDRHGVSPLQTARYWRAYLAFDPRTEKRRAIDSRIAELERLHKSYVPSLCSAVSARLAMTGTYGPDPDAVVHCLMALVLVGDSAASSKFEGAYRSRRYVRLSHERDCADPIVLDGSYAKAYVMLDMDDEATSYARRVASAQQRNPAAQCVLRKKIEDELNRLTGMGNARRQLFAVRIPGGNVAAAVEWVRGGRVSHSYMEPPEQCRHLEVDFPDPRSNVVGYLKHKDEFKRDSFDVLEPTEEDRNARIAEHNACAAFLLGHDWAKYHWTMKYWAKHSP